MTPLNAATAKSTTHSDDLSQQIDALKADVSRLMSTVSDDVSGGLSQAGRQISRTGNDARVSATNTVLDHPLAAVGIAVGVGLLMGLVARKG
jgi:ElaB/YqjD/DUF883 family membrane-anchored ribosome-binding protein